MKKNYILNFLAGLAALVCVTIFAKSIDQTEPIDGTQRNRITGSSSSGGGGGIPDPAGLSSNNVFTGSNTFTGTNTFNNTTYFNGDIVQTNAGATGIINTKVIKWATGAVTLEEDLDDSSTQAFLFKKNGVTVASFPGATFDDSGSTPTIDGTARNLLDANGSINFNWSGNTITNYANFLVFSNLTVGKLSSTHNILGEVFIGTNIVADPAAILYLQQNGSQNTFEINGDTPAITLGNLFGSDTLTLRRSSTQAFINWAGSSSLFFQRGGTTKLTLDTTAWTVGDSSSFNQTWNGIAIAIPNGINIGSGQLQIPSSGTLTNSSSFTTLNTTTTSNLVVNTPDLWARFTAGTSTNAFLNGAGTVPMQNSYRSVTMTNMPNGAQFSNAGNFYTNIQQQATVRFTVVLPGTATQLSTLGIFRISGSYTNIEGMVSGAAYLNGQSTNTAICDLNPGDLFFPTNVSVIGGIPTMVPGRSTITFK